MFGQKQLTASSARLPFGERVYAIGDLHGEAALFDQMLALINSDNARRGPARTTLVLLGDIIDRGKNGAQLLRMLARLRDPRFVVLKGNHEALLVDSWRGDQKMLRVWLHVGGRSTLAGLGIPERDLQTRDGASLISALQSSVEPELVDWVDNLPLSWSLGDYFFTHAGIKPGVALNRQKAEHLLWIRDPFLSSPRNHGKVIVHGHTVEEGVPGLGGNRIGLDTGAHEHGRLTALGLEGDQQWLLQATLDVNVSAVNDSESRRMTSTGRATGDPLPTSDDADARIPQQASLAAKFRPSWLARPNGVKEPAF